MAAASAKSRSQSRCPLERSRAPRWKSSPLLRTCLPLDALRVDDNAVALARGILLDHDRIGAGRQHAAGEDARGFAGAHGALERMSGRDFADELEPDRDLGDVAARTA